MKRKTPGKANAPNTNANLQPEIQTVLPTQEEWLNTAETMSYFRVSDRTLYRWRETQQIPSLKVGGTVLYPLNLLNQILRKKIQPEFTENS